MRSDKGQLDVGNEQAREGHTRLVNLSRCLAVENAKVADHNHTAVILRTKIRHAC